jgi:hypothetical protein
MPIQPLPTAVAPENVAMNGALSGVTEIPIATVIADEKRYRHCELADWSHLVEFKLDDRSRTRPNLLHKIWFRELTGKDFFEMANGDGSAIDKTQFVIARLATRFEGNFPDFGEVNPNAPTEYDIKGILNRIPAWQITAISKVVATFLDADSE